MREALLLTFFGLLLFSGILFVWAMFSGVRRLVNFFKARQKKQASEKYAKVYAKSPDFLRQPSKERYSERFASPFAEGNKDSVVIDDAFLYFSRFTVRGEVEWTGKTGELNRNAYDQAYNSYQIAESNYQIALQNYADRVDRARSNRKEPMAGIFVAATRPRKPEEPDEDDFITYKRVSDSFRYEIPVIKILLDGFFTSSAAGATALKDGWELVNEHYEDIVIEMFSAFERGDFPEDGADVTETCLNGPLQHWKNHAYEKSEVTESFSFDTYLKAKFNEWIEFKINEYIEEDYDNISDVKFTTEIKQVHKEIMILPAVLVMKEDEVYLVDHVDPSNYIKLK